MDTFISRKQNFWIWKKIDLIWRSALWSLLAQNFLFCTRIIGVPSMTQYRTGTRTGCTTPWPGPPTPPPHPPAADRSEVLSGMFTYLNFLIWIYVIWYKHQIRKTGRETDTQTDRHTERGGERKKERQTDRNKERVLENVKENICIFLSDLEFSNHSLPNQYFQP